MRIIEERERTERGFEIIYKCPHCNTKNAILYKEIGTGIDQIEGLQDCEHMKWEVVGNPCFDEVYKKDEICEGLEELKKKSTLRLSDERNTYFLLPHQS